MVIEDPLTRHTLSFWGMACIQLVAVLLKLIFAHLQNLFEKNSGSMGAFGIAQSTLQQDTEYLLQESHLHCQRAKGKSQFVSPGWSPFIFSFGWRVALSCIHFFPPPSVSPFKCFMGSKLIACAITAAFSRCQDGFNNDRHNSDAVKPISG